MRNAALRKFLEHNPEAEGLLFALAEPISDQLEVRREKISRS